MNKYVQSPLVLGCICVCSAGLIGGLHLVAEKYAEYQTESLGDLFMRETLKDRGVTMPQTSGEVKRR